MKDDNGATIVHMLITMLSRGVIGSKKYLQRGGWPLIPAEVRAGGRPCSSSNTCRRNLGMISRSLSPYLRTIAVGGSPHPSYLLPSWPLPQLVSSQAHCFSSAAASVSDEDDGSCSFKIQEDEKVDDLFQVLNLPRTFEISPEELKSSYRSLMTKYHPDKLQHGNPEEIENAEMMASRVTNAYQILNKPHTRAIHLLELVGSPLDETSQTNLVGTEFLMEIMEIREDVDRIDPKNMKPIWEETNARIHHCIDELSTAFDECDYKQAMQFTSQLQYWYRIQTAIYEKMELEDRNNGDDR